MKTSARFLRAAAVCASAILATALAGGPAVGQDEPVPSSSLSWMTGEVPPEDGAQFRLNGLAMLPTGEASIVGSSMVGDAPPLFSGLAQWSSDGIAWEAVDVPKSEDVGSISGVATAPSGFVAAGTEPSSGGLVWTSPDGREWGSPAKIKGAQIHGVSNTSLGPVLTGESGALKSTNRKGLTRVQWVNKGAILWRLDKNGKWKPTKVAKQGWARDAVVSDGGVWLVRGYQTVKSNSGDTLEERVWRSSDGKAWRKVEIRRSAAQDGSPFRIDSLVAAPGGFLATAIYNQGAGSYLTTIMASSDGLEWTEVARAERKITSLVSGPLGVLALGPGSGPGTGAVAASTDGGRTWERVPEPAFDGESEPTLATGTADGFMALGQPSDPSLPQIVWRATVNSLPTSGSGPG